MFRLLERQAVSLSARSFFTGAGLGLAVRFVAFAALDTLRALPRPVAAFLFCAFDCFLRLAMIAPSWLVVRNALMPDRKTISQPSYELF